MIVINSSLQDFTHICENVGYISHKISSVFKSRKMVPTYKTLTSKDKYDNFLNGMTYQSTLENVIYVQ